MVGEVIVAFLQRKYVESLDSSMGCARQLPSCLPSSTFLLTLLTGRLYSLRFLLLVTVRPSVCCCSIALSCFVAAQISQRLQSEDFGIRQRLGFWGRPLPRWRSPRSHRRRAMAEARPQWWTMRRKLCWCKRKWSAWRGSRPPAPTLRTGSKCSTKCSSSCPRWEGAVECEHSWLCAVFVSLLVFGFVAKESAVAVTLHFLQLAFQHVNV